MDELQGARDRQGGKKGGPEGVGGGAVGQGRPGRLRTTGPASTREGSPRRGGLPAASLDACWLGVALRGLQEGCCCCCCGCNAGPGAGGCQWWAKGGVSGCGCGRGYRRRVVAAAVLLGCGGNGGVPLLALVCRAACLPTSKNPNLASIPCRLFLPCKCSSKFCWRCVDATALSPLLPPPPLRRRSAAPSEPRPPALLAPAGRRRGPQEWGRSLRPAAAGRPLSAAAA